MQNPMDSDALLRSNISLTIAPVVHFSKAPSDKAQTEQLSSDLGRFAIQADVALQYQSLSRIINDYMAGKRVDLSEGFFARHIVIQKVAVSGTAAGALLLKASFTGSFNGTLLFSGVPVFNDDTKKVVLLHLRYDLQTNNLLLKGAKLLFASRIEKELKKAASFSVSRVFEEAEKAITDNLNKEWAKGVSGAGDVADLRLLNIQVMPEHLLAKMLCEGSLQLTISELLLNFKR